MKLKGILIAAAVCVVIPTTASAAPVNKADRDAARAACKAERAAMGGKLFRATYGPSPVRRCMAAEALEARDDRVNAARACAAEREADPAAFAATYGGANAFGKCVSGKRRAERAEEASETVNAARRCRSERAADAAAFAAAYGTHRNAFGKCVSQKEEAEDAAEETADEGSSGSGEQAEPAPATA